MSTTAKFVKEITVEDPDTGAPIEMEVYKHENGGMFAIDSSFLDQVAPEEGDEDDTAGYDPSNEMAYITGESKRTIILDPFSHGEPETLYLEE
jgi:hypothetical protein